MRALTIHQPWASLIACGAKTIETRSWSTKYRGPLLVHAAAWEMSNCVKEYDANPAAWDALQASPCDSWPRGAVVAVAELVDVVPIGGPYSFRTGIVQGDEGDFPDSRVIVHDPAMGDWAPERLVIDHPYEDVTDQLPLGDFAPGRWGWLLDNVRPIDPISAKGRQGLWTPNTALLDLLAEGEAGVSS